MELFSVELLRIESRQERSCHKTRECAEGIPQSLSCLRQGGITGGDRLKALWLASGYLKNLIRRRAEFKSASTVIVKVMAESR